MINLKNIQLSDEERKRYMRHLNLSLVKQQGQTRIMSAKILFIGAGGLASSSLLYLAAAGIKTIGIIDNDFVEISNLQRQVIHSEKTVGMLKAISAKDSIKGLNHNCQVKAYCCKLNSDNALKIIKHYNIVIDCTDNIYTRNILNSICAILNMPYMYAAISQFIGQVSVFHFQNGISYDDIICSHENIENCNNNGVIGILPGAVGLFQANEIIKIIVGIPINLSKYMLVYDSLQSDCQKIKLRKHKKKLLSRRELIKYTQSNNPKSFHTILMPNYLIVDIRDSYSSKIYPIDNALRIPMHKIINDTSIDFIKEKSIHYNIYIYCETDSKTDFIIKLLEKNKIIARKYG
uniref:Molybdopterin biosynthesis protein n=1 Tax=Porphyridium purpureum TaxID=35688 RepID=A0A343KP11_PORPP|nr:molybdopterin biosynthesis protein [Porphyridium purpureum]